MLGVQIVFGVFIMHWELKTYAIASQLQQVRLEKQQSLDALKLAQEIQNQVQSLEARKTEDRPVHCHDFRYMILWSCYFKRYPDLGKHFTGFE